MAGISDDIENLRVNRADFMNALDEVTPAFGVAKEELEQVVQNGIIHFSSTVDVSHPLPGLSSLGRSRPRRRTSCTPASSSSTRCACRRGRRS